MEKYNTYLIEDFVIDDFFIRWVLSNSDEDNEIWTQWLRNNPGQGYKVEQARNIINSVRFNKVEDISQAKVDLFIKRLKTEYISQQYNTQPAIKSRIINLRWLGVAASIIAVVSFGLFFVIHQFKPAASTASYALAPTVYREIINGGTSPMLIHLADGTSVILKPRSTFTYPQAFLKKNREVYLTGEAFFEVHKNPKQPFLVHSGKMMVRVVGTTFTVRAFNGASDFKVTVNTGKVYVYAPPVGRKDHKIAEPVVLTHDQQVTYSSSDTQLVKQDLSKPTPLSQQVVQKTFDFKGIPVKEIINTLKQTYQVDIIYNEKAFENCKLTAKLYDDSLYDKLTIICNAIDAKFTIVNGQIMITGGGGCNI